MSIPFWRGKGGEVFFFRPKAKAENRESRSVTIRKVQWGGEGREERLILPQQLFENKIDSYLVQVMHSLHYRVCHLFSFALFSSLESSFFLAVIKGRKIFWRFWWRKWQWRWKYWCRKLLEHRWSCLWISRWNRSHIRSFNYCYLHNRPKCYTSIKGLGRERRRGPRRIVSPFLLLFIYFHPGFFMSTGSQGKGEQEGGNSAVEFVKPKNKLYSSL